MWVISALLIFASGAMLGKSSMLSALLFMAGSALLYFSVRKERVESLRNAEEELSRLNSQISHLLSQNGLLEMEIKRLENERKNLASQMELMKERLKKYEESIPAEEAEKERVKRILEKAGEFEFEI